MILLDLCNDDGGFIGHTRLSYLLKIKSNAIDCVMSASNLADEAFKMWDLGPYVDNKA